VIAQANQYEPIFLVQSPDCNDFLQFKDPFQIGIPEWWQGAIAVNPSYALETPNRIVNSSKKNNKLPGYSL
jgi:hypothetical protein